VLSQEEVLQFFDSIPSLKYRAALMTCYGAGLRVSEAVALQVSDIDSQRMLIRVQLGKGAKDRYAMLPRVCCKSYAASGRPPGPPGTCSPPGEPTLISASHRYNWPAGKRRRSPVSARESPSTRALLCRVPDYAE
jgi:integrase